MKFQIRTFTTVLSLMGLLWAPAWCQSQAQQGAKEAQAAQAPQNQPPMISGTPRVGDTDNVKVDATKQWVDTNLDLRVAEKIRITATGSIKYPADKKHPDGRTLGPAGLTRGYADLIHQYAVPDGGHGALIGRLGSDEGAQPFLVGESMEYTAPIAGRLFIGLNQSNKDAEAATGSFQVKIEVLEAGLTTANVAADSAMPYVTQAVLAQIPRRVKDQQGNPGDMVNALIIGSKDQMLLVFKNAGWVQVDKSVQEAVVGAIVQSLERTDYLTMPMSVLYLFGRGQDYGMAHAEPVKVAMSRNHLRVWLAPDDLIPGKTVWCVAATHDIGFERDQRNNGVTHKIDPDIDKEREYVNQTLTDTGMVGLRSHVTPKDPLTTAKTATGGEFHSDGRILVLVLQDLPTTGKAPGISSSNR
jgi:LssY C-terminus